MRDKGRRRGEIILSVMVKMRFKNVFWVWCNDGGNEKRFILNVNILIFFFFPDWLSTALKFFIFYLILFADLPFNPVVSFPRCKPDVFNVYGCFIAQCLRGVVLTSVMAGCVTASCLIFEDWSELLEPQSINGSNWFLIPTDHPRCVWLIEPWKLAALSQNQSQPVCLCVKMHKYSRGIRIWTEFMVH